MQTTFMGGGVVLEPTDVVRFGPLRIWTERGLIHIEDSRDNSYKTVTTRDELFRLQAVNDMLANSRRQKGSEDQFDETNCARIRKALEAVIIVCQKARQHGDPFDAAREQNKNLRRRTPRTLVTPGYGGGL